MINNTNPERTPFRAGLFVALFVGGLALGANAFAQPCVEPPPGLVGWWTGDGNTKDLISGASGGASGGAGYAAGQVGQAFKLDGVDDVITVGHTASLALRKFTVETWIRLDKAPSVGKGIVTKGVTGTQTSENPGRNFNFALFADAPVSPATAGTITGGFEDSKGNNFFVTSKSTASPSKFVHCAVTYDGSAVKLYFNGAQEGATLTTSATPDLNALNLVIGGTVKEKGSPATEFPGLIDEVCIYNRALSAAEIKRIFDAKSGKCRATINGTGAGNPNTLMSLALRDFLAPSRTYRVATSLGIGPIPIDNRAVGLSFDWLLVLTINNALPGVFQNYANVTGSQGTAKAALLIPDIAALVGFEFHTAFVTLNAASPSGVQSISNTYSFKVVAKGP